MVITLMPFDEFCTQWGLRDACVQRPIWLPVQYGNEKPDKIDASTLEVMHMKTTSSIRCFKGTSLHNNFNEETKADYNNFNEEIEADVLPKKIGIMFENKHIVNRGFVFRKIVKLRYQDGSSMAVHLNAF